MSLYRGAGGASDATDDSTVNAVAGYASSAASSASAAAASATTATNNATAAATSASQAASSVSTAASSASNAAASASNAASSASSASSSASSASSSASSASISAGQASNYASEALGYRNTASTHATNAASSASAAAGSATSAADSAADALAIYGNTAAMESAVADAVEAAATAQQESQDASDSAVAAAASEALAHEHEQNAAEWASTAQGSANNAQAYATSALAARDATLQAYDNFDDRYLGTKSSDPIVDNDGNPLIAGALYFSSTTGSMKVYTGSAWVDAYVSGTGFLAINNNLSDIQSAATARTNLGLGSAALENSTALVHTTGDETIAGTKTFSSNPVLSAGTANGLAFLNGSKVLTTGNALTFDGTNLGVGVTPSAWAANWKAIQIGSGMSLFTTSISAGVASNAYFNGTSWTYLTTGAATYSYQASGQHQWHTAPSGTAGAAISFTQAMTLSAAGGLSIGTTTDAGAGGLRITGNAILGDASTDTVTVNGYMGVGGAANSSYGLFVQPNALTGTTQRGIQTYITASNGATTSIRGIQAGIQTQAASFTTADAMVFVAGSTSLGAGSTITNNHGLYIFDQSAGTNNYGITSLVSSGTNKWNIYASGTANNYFAGNIGLGVTPSAWIAGVSAFDIGARGTVYTGSVSTGLVYNGYVGSGSWTYKQTAVASRYEQNNGSHVWYTAPSGTAGNAITFTQAATLTANGEYLIGLTSATGVAKLQVSGPLRTTGYTVATLPAGTVGMRTYVTDALAPSFGATVVGGGAVTIPVFYNGTNWIVA